MSTSYSEDCIWWMSSPNSPSKVSLTNLYSIICIERTTQMKCNSFLIKQQILSESCIITTVFQWYFLIAVCTKNLPIYTVIAKGRQSIFIIYFSFLQHICVHISSLSSLALSPSLIIMAIVYSISIRESIIHVFNFLFFVSNVNYWPSYVSFAHHRCQNTLLVSSNVHI